MKSMTGFGRGEAAIEGTTISVEVSSVNRKQIDVAISLPRPLAELESKVRTKVQSAVSRGRVNVSINVETGGDLHKKLTVDRELARTYLAALHEIADETGEPVSFTSADLLRAPGIFTLGDVEIDIDAAWQGIESALENALANLIQSRTDEGTSLKADFESRLATVRECTAGIAKLAPRITTHYRDNLTRRLEEAGVPVDLSDDRLVREIGLFAERCDISEELTRLDSHLAKFEEFLSSTEPTGRSMDFLAQELNREFNTIGSKANDAEIAHLVVDGKTEVEKIREQVQNVE
ncbi:MAG: YicC/YloC family endoribonuclease [Verrucomicrobiota bacterium]